MRAAKWFFRNWYWFNGGVAVIAAIGLVAGWGDLSVVQRILLGQFIVMNLHFVEEFALPGGFPVLANTVEKSSDKPEAYPLNQWNAAAGNNWFAFLIYLPAFLLPDQQWLAMTVTVFGFVEFLMHLGGFNVMLKRAYNPGVVTSLVGFLPLSIAYLVHTYSTGTGPAWWLYLVGLAVAMANYFVVFNWLLVTLLASRNTRFPFTKAEMDRGWRWTAKIHPQDNTKFAEQSGSGTPNAEETHR